MKATKRKTGPLVLIPFVKQMEKDAKRNGTPNGSVSSVEGQRHFAREIILKLIERIRRI